MPILTTVDLLVPLQQILLDEAHVALTAPERPLTCAIKNTSIRTSRYLMTKMQRGLVRAAAADSGSTGNNCNMRAYEITFEEVTNSQKNRPGRPDTHESTCVTGCVRE